MDSKNNATCPNRISVLEQRPRVGMPLDFTAFFLDLYTIHVPQIWQITKQIF